MEKIEKLVFGNLKKIRIYVMRDKLEAPLKGENFLFLDFNTEVMRDFDELFSELKLKLQLPDYANKNFDSLDECLTDLEWLPADGYILYFENAQNILCKENADDFQAFIRLLDDAGKEWHDPDPGRSELEQIKKNFAVLLHFDSEAYDEFTSLLTASKIEFGIGTCR